MREGPNPEAVGIVAAEHMGPILYALELCALSMDEVGRSQDASYYRAVAAKLAGAGGSVREPSNGVEATSQ
jgi:hypothetical protein